MEFLPGAEVECKTDRETRARAIARAIEHDFGIKNCFVNERYCRCKNFNKNRDKKPQKTGMMIFPRDFMHKNFTSVTKD